MAVQESSSRGPIRNLRVHFYGVQGSGSTFPSRAERAEVQDLWDEDLLRQMFADIARRAGPDGKVHCGIEEVLGGPLDRQTLRAYRKRLNVTEPRVYGGWTTCVRVETGDGYDIVFDCGSGFRNCAKDLQATWGERPRRDVHIFGSHSHLDHTEGFDQAAICFDPRNKVHVYGNRQFLRTLDSNLGIFTHHVADTHLGVHTPISFAAMPAQFESTEIRDFTAHPLPAVSASDPLATHYHDLGRPVQLGATSIQPFELCHPAPCLGFRVEHGGRSFVFCTDHELSRPPMRAAEISPAPAGVNDVASDALDEVSRAAERRLIALATGVDLLYRDGQYLRAEYDGVVGVGTSGAASRRGWGHSCIEDVVAMAYACRVKRTLIGHHDPNREWAERNRLDEVLAQQSAGLVSAGATIELARAETIVDL